MVDMPVPTARAAECSHGANAFQHPLERVFDLGASDRRRAISIALAVALLAHAGMAGAIRLRDENLDALGTFLDVQEVEIVLAIVPVLPEPAPLPPEPPREPMKVVDKVIGEAPPIEEEPAPPDEPPASEAAQAGEVLIAEADETAEEDEDNDDNTFVTGTADSYAGGATAANGTSVSAVHGTVVEMGGIPGGRGIAVVAPPPKPSTPDLSRGAWLDGSASWECEFPGEANRDHVDRAAVEMTVVVSPNGKPHSITITDDPGHGFARMASACALDHTFLPAHDRNGRPIWGTTRPFHVGFYR